MKKLITITLILALLLPAAALASDPIIGGWYMYIDLVDHPEMKATYGDYDRIIDIYLFDEAGNISLLEGIITNGMCTPTFAGSGKWEARAFDYKVSIVGFGETSMSVDGDEAKIKIPSAGAMNVYLKMRRLVPFDMYKDYLY